MAFDNKERDELRKQGRLAGVGLAMYVEVCGIGPWFYAERLPLTEFRYG